MGTTKNSPERNQQIQIQTLSANTVKELDSRVTTLEDSGGGVEAARFSLSSTTGTFTTTATTCPIDRADADQPWVSNSSGTFTLSAGTYLITADVTIDENSGNNRTEFGSVVQENSSGSYVDVPGTERRHYSRNNAQGGQSASATCLLTFGSSASIRMQSRRVSGSNTGEWIADGCSVTILKL